MSKGGFIVKNMDAKKIFITEEGLEELKKEFEDLQNDKRPKVLERLAEARAMGDLSENSEYTAAREELALMDGRIEELQEILKGAEIIKEDHSSKGKKEVKLGSKVKVKVKDKHDVFALVGEWKPIQKRRKFPMNHHLEKHSLEKVLAITSKSKLQLEKLCIPL